MTYVEDRGNTPAKIVSTSRIGVNEGKEKQWRFYIENNEFVSRQPRSFFIVPYSLMLRQWQLPKLIRPATLRGVRTLFSNRYPLLAPRTEQNRYNFDGERDKSRVIREWKMTVLHALSINFALIQSFEKIKNMKKNTRNTRNARNTHCHSFYPVVFLHLKKSPSELSSRLNCDTKPAKPTKHKKHIADSSLNIPFLTLTLSF